MSEPVSPESRRGSHRPVSVNLRAEGEEAGGTAAMLDPANQSLADALRITFRLLQLAMVVLFGLFLLSGFKSVKEGERGIRLLFGKVTGDDLAPGFRYSFPFPVGDLVRVKTTAPQVDIATQFWVGLRPEQVNMGTDQLATLGKRSLDPGRDGSVILGDGKLANTKWTARYVRRSPSSYARKINPDHEERIVRAAVHRGVVHACARVTIDDLLKQSTDQVGSVSAYAQEVAQEMLDRLDSGLLLEELKLIDKIAPPPVLTEFGQVQEAEQQANQKRIEASTTADATLKAAAGDAVPILTDLIDRYEAALKLEDAGEATRVRGWIDAVMLGQEVEIDGKKIPAVVSGEVSKTIGESSLYRDTIAGRTRAELGLFESKLKAYNSNPKYVVVSEWANAFNAFNGRDSVERIYLPRGVRHLQLVLARDPEILKRLDHDRKRRQAEEAARLRNEAFERERLKTDTDKIKATSD